MQHRDIFIFNFKTQFGNNLRIPLHKLFSGFNSQIN
jgi:hypothetical protein